MMPLEYSQLPPAPGGKDYARTKRPDRAPVIQAVQEYKARCDEALEAMGTAEGVDRRLEQVVNKLDEAYKNGVLYFPNSTHCNTDMPVELEVVNYNNAQEYVRETVASLKPMANWQRERLNEMRDACEEFLSQPNALPDDKWISGIDKFQEAHLKYVSADGITEEQEKQFRADAGKLIGSLFNSPYVDKKMPKLGRFLGIHRSEDKRSREFYAVSQLLMGYIDDDAFRKTIADENYSVVDDIVESICSLARSCGFPDVRFEVQEGEKEYRCDDPYSKRQIDNVRVPNGTHLVRCIGTDCDVLDVARKFKDQHSRHQTVIDHSK